MTIHAFRRAMLGTSLLIAVASAAVAQANCTNGAGEVTFGFGAIDCLQCTVHTAPGDQWVEYGAEPVVRFSTFRVAGVQATTFGAVQAGDVLIAIDGTLITTPAGGRALANPVAGRATRFTIRRDGRQMDVTLTPVFQCRYTAGGGVLLSQLPGAAALFHSAIERACVRGARDTTVARAHVDHPRGILFRMDSTVNGRLQGHIVFCPDSAGGLEIRRDSAAAIGTTRVITEPYDIARGGRVGQGTTSDGGAISGRIQLNAQFDSAGRRIVFTRNDSARVVTADTTYSVSRGGRAGTLVGRGGGRGGRGVAAASAARGWLGFGLDCSDCTSEVSADGVRSWHFRTAPNIAAIDPGGPADLAGALAGDTLRAIDGLAITSADGAARFSALRAGQRVRLMVERRGHTVEIIITAASRTG